MTPQRRPRPASPASSRRMWTRSSLPWSPPSRTTCSTPSSPPCSSSPSLAELGAWEVAAGPTARPGRPPPAPHRPRARWPGPHGGCAPGAARGASPRRRAAGPGALAPAARHRPVVTTSDRTTGSRPLRRPGPFACPRCLYLRRHSSPARRWHGLPSSSEEGAAMAPPDGSMLPRRAMTPYGASTPSRRACWPRGDAARTTASTSRRSIPSGPAPSRATPSSSSAVPRSSAACTRRWPTSRSA